MADRLEQFSVSVIDHADKDIQLLLREFAERSGETVNYLIDDGTPHLIIRKFLRRRITHGQ